MRPRTTFAEGARELAYKLGSIESDGIPWLAILDKSGQVLTTSHNAGRNIGFPSTVADKAYFFEMLRSTQARATVAQIAAVRSVLDSF